MNYNDFLKSKIKYHESLGFNIETKDVNSLLFDFQKEIVKKGLGKGKFAIFADTGLGKTFMQLEWSRFIYEKYVKPILIVAPLAVAQQTQKEGVKINLKVNICNSQDDVINGINITNYEKLHKFQADRFVAVVLDESSILKSYSGKIRTQIINMFLYTEYKLACTATPSPNDYMELGNHSEYLNVLSRKEMLSTFFVHDGGSTQNWKIKSHAEDEFWKWVSSWAITLQKPSDIGFDDDGYILPELKYHNIILDTEKWGNTLFQQTAKGLNDYRKARRSSIEIRVQKAAEIANEKDCCLVWCDLNDESRSLKKLILGSEEVTGSDKIEKKESSLVGFSNGTIKKLVTKSSIAGFGMNWQHCNNMIFVGLNYSYEQFYQAVRRCWRFGQKNDVNCYLILSDRETNSLNVIQSKEKKANEMREKMIQRSNIEIVHNVKLEDIKLIKEFGENWEIIRGDAVVVLESYDDNCIDYFIFSPPFPELYTYSSMLQDIGNCRDYNEFFENFKYVTKNLYRTLKNGRLCSIHCMDIPIFKERHGYIGLRDFPGDLIKLMQSEGFIYHSKHVIWKNPLIEVTRTKALGLMHKQIQKDSTLCRAGTPDQLVTFRKPGENLIPVSHPDGFTEFIGDQNYKPKTIGIKYSHVTWQKYASPVWMDINQSNTLQRTSARDEKDEKHICPLQLEVIERGLVLYTNKGDVVGSPFAGIGSEGHQAILSGRKFMGIELKESYFLQAVKNLRYAEKKVKQVKFNLLEE